MPGDQYVAASEGIHPAIGGTVVLDLLGASTRRLNCNELSVTCNGTSSTATPLTVRLVRTTGTPVGGGTITQAPTPMDPSAPASTVTAYQPTSATPGIYATTAPTVGVILGTWYVPPTSGMVLQLPQGLEADVAVSAGIGVQILAPADVLVNTYLKWIE